MRRCAPKQKARRSGRPGEAAYAFAAREPYSAETHDAQIALAALARPALTSFFVLIGVMTWLMVS